MSKVKTVVKAAAKTAVKAAPKAKAKPVAKVEAAPLFYATLLTEALAGNYGDSLKRYYKRAVENHDDQKTVFPRPRLIGKPLLNPTEAVAYLEAHKLTSIPSANPLGQRLFDEMAVQTVGGLKSLR